VPVKVEMEVDVQLAEPWQDSHFAACIGISCLLAALMVLIFCRLG
jgi:hypothetical protein